MAFDPDKFLAESEDTKKKGFDPDKFLRETEPETALQTVGRSTASLADTALNTLTGTLDYGAYALARAAGLSPEEATKQTTSPKDVIGRTFNVTGTPGYENAPLRAMGNVVGEAIGENVVQPIAQTTGLPEQDVSNMLTSATIGAAPMVKPIVRGAQATVSGVGDVVGGAKGALSGKIAKPGEIPQPWQQASSRIPVESTYITPENLQAWREGRISTTQLQQSRVPTEQMGPEAMQALQRTGGTIPVQGQGLRAFGESIGETYRNPINVLTDVGLDVLTGGGLPTMARLGYKGYGALQNARAANILQKQGFTAQTPAEMAAIRSGAKYPGPINTPAQASQQAAASRIQQPMQPVNGPVIPTPVQPITPQSVVQPEKLAPQPGPTPTPIKSTVETLPSERFTTEDRLKVKQLMDESNVRDVKTISEELTKVSNESDLLHQQGLEQGLKYGTPEGDLHQAKLGQLLEQSRKLEKELELAKKVEKKLSKKKGPDVSQMLTEDTIFNTKAEWEKANLMNTLAEKKRVGGYKENGYIVREEEPNYSGIPEGLRKELPKREIVKRTTKGKRVQE